MQHRGLSFLVLLIGCDGATTISKNNDEPVAKIDDPADGSTVQEGSTVTFSGTVLDDDDDAETLVATWFSGAEVLCAEAPVGADGATVCEVEIGLGDTEITLEALTLAWTDGDGAPLSIDDAPDTDGSLLGTLRLPAGTHTLTLSVTDTAGATGTASVTINVEG